VRSYFQEHEYKIIEPSEVLGKELPISSQYNKANIKKLSDKELRIFIDSENASQHTKKLAFDELTNRNKTQVKKLRRGKHWKQCKCKRDLSRDGTAKGK
jgi:hypothetical protein